MPATMTHSYFAIDVFQQLDNYNKNLIKDNLLQYKMFSQSTDSLMFYNIESLKRGKKIRDFQYVFHTTKSRLFFSRLIYNIKHFKLENNKTVISYLYGMICHYVLDSNVHPFVFYKTGHFDKNDKTTYKYNNLHSFMETFIDIEMMKKNGISNPFGFRIDKFSFDLTKFDTKLQLVIDSTFFDVFNIKNMASIYYKSLIQMKRFIKRYRIDSLGIKNIFYKTIDKFTPSNTFRFEALSYHYKSQYRDYFLNSNNHIWYNPIDDSIYSYDSFDDLYCKSIKEAIFIIQSVSDYLRGKNINLEKVFSNKSYLSGLDCDLKIIFKNVAF